MSKPYATIEITEDEFPHESEYVTSDYNFDEQKIDYTQWSNVGDGSFIPAPATVKSLPPGLYEITWNNKMSDWAFLKQPLNTDELYELPTQEIGEILGDIKKFWQKIETYKEYKLMHKRGILLYGDPGCGKSGILQLCMKHIIKDLSGIVINLKDEDSIKAYAESVPKLRQIEPTRPLVVIIEDIDSVAGDSNYSTSVLLNILDGIKQIENVVYIATTNYPEKLEERITNRPSRFDRRYYIAPPSSEVRKAYLQKKIGKSKSKINISQWVKDTEGLSMSHLKELFISVVVLDNDYDSAIEHLKGLKKAPRNGSQKGVGFSN
jgi:energy-coupling factor transporter ATP-binding protein EcfA2